MSKPPVGRLSEAFTCPDFTAKPGFWIIRIVLAGGKTGHGKADVASETMIEFYDPRFRPQKIENGLSGQFICIRPVRQVLQGSNGLVLDAGDLDRQISGSAMARIRKKIEERLVDIYASRISAELCSMSPIACVEIIAHAVYTSSIDMGRDLVRREAWCNEVLTAAEADEDDMNWRRAAIMLARLGWSDLELARLNQDLPEMDESLDGGDIAVRIGADQILASPPLPRRATRSDETRQLRA